MSNATTFSIKINGLPATEIAAHSAPTIETLADGGIGQIKFALALSARSQHQALRKGALVEVQCCGFTIASALLTEPDRTTWECYAYGLSRELDKRLARDGSGTITRDLAVALATAASTGVPILNTAPVTGTVAGGSDGSPITVAKLHDQFAEQTGRRWGVDGQRRPYMRPDPGSPKWLATPDAAAFGVTDEDVVTRLVGLYDAGGGIEDIIVVGTAGPEEPVDIRDRGPITPVAAEAILAGKLQRRGETSWTNGVTLHREQLTTIGGSPAFLPSVVAGQMLRAHGLASNVISQAPWLDIVIGKTQYTAGEDVIYLEPVNTAPRGYEAVTAAA